MKAIRSKNNNNNVKEVKYLKKAFVILLVFGLLFAMSSVAFAIQDGGGKGNIIPNQYTLDDANTTWDADGNSSTTDDQMTIPAKDWNYKEQGVNKGVVYRPYDYAVDSSTVSTHLYGTWNSPYTLGVDGYNYNDAQDYTDTGTQVDKGSTTLTNTDPYDNVFTSGPHGGYLTTTHKCRDCHAVHRAAGKFKLLRADTRFEACDWCHGTGAGSGFNIQMDNDDAYKTEYNVGHTMGFGIESGKWKAPDDTYPAFTPNYWMGGFSCFDCHSPHANPMRLLGFDGNGQPKGIVSPAAGVAESKVYGIANPGHDQLTSDSTLYILDTNKPIYLSGSWLLIKNADREIMAETETIHYRAIGSDTTSTVTIGKGDEIDDYIAARQDIIDGEPITVAGLLGQYANSMGWTVVLNDATSTANKYPVNKIATDWDNPVGGAFSSAVGDEREGFDYSSTDGVWTVSEFCTDCHDGNAGLHTVQAPLFSEDRALRDQGSAEGTSTIGGNYDLAYGHDAQPRHCSRQMKFNPEDGYDFGPNCRNCHKGASACGTCHSSTVIGSLLAVTNSITDAADNTQDLSTYDVSQTSTGVSNYIAVTVPSPYASSVVGFYKRSRDNYSVSSSTRWSTNWRSSDSRVNMGNVMLEGFESDETTVGVPCSDDGFSWPHRTLGWKMLKDDLFGLDIDGTVVGPSEQRTAISGSPVAQDLDGVCLDCHNPTVWRASTAAWDEGPSENHTDDPDDDYDNYNDELILRGIP